MLELKEAEATNMSIARGHERSWEGSWQMLKSKRRWLGASRIYQPREEEDNILVHLVAINSGSAEKRGGAQ